MFYTIIRIPVISLFLISFFVLISCQKETGDNNTANQKPRVGSKWIYRYTTYYTNGGINTSYDVTYRAVGMETLGGEQWLKIIDSATGSTVFYLKEKADGLYQYVNNNSYLMCKYPAAVNDSFPSNSGTTSAMYYVRSVGQIQSFGVLNDLVVNYYEATVQTPNIGTQTVDKLWYNTRVWLAQRYIYRDSFLNPVYYRVASLIIQDFIY